VSKQKIFRFCLSSRIEAAAEARPFQHLSQTATHSLPPGAIENGSRWLITLDKRVNDPSAGSPTER